jgi:hypothetical protein
MLSSTSLAEGGNMERNLRYVDISHVLKAGVKQEYRKFSFTAGLPIVPISLPTLKTIVD